MPNRFCVVFSSNLHIHHTHNLVPQYCSTNPIALNKHAQQRHDTPTRLVRRQFTALYRHSLYCHTIPLEFVSTISFAIVHRRERSFGSLFITEVSNLLVLGNFCTVAILL